MLGIVTFERGKNGVLTKWEGKIAFPDKKIEGFVRPGDVCVVLRATPNPRQTVFFLQCVPLDSALQDPKLRARLEEELQWKETYAPPYGLSWFGRRGQYIVIPERRYSVSLYLKPWHAGPFEVDLEAQEVEGIHIPAQKVRAHFSEDGVPVLIVLDRAVPKEWTFRALQGAQSAPPKVRAETVRMLVGHRVPVWPAGAKVYWQGYWVPVQWPIMEESVTESFPPNTGEWILLEERFHIHQASEPIYGHYGDEAWVSSVDTKQRKVWRYRLRHWDTGEEVVVDFPYPVTNWRR